MSTRGERVTTPRAITLFATVIAAMGALGLAARAATGPARPGEGALAPLGVRLSPFPDGEGRAIAEKACLQCHSADMARQQRLTEKQWTAEVEKMIRWGAEVSAADKAALTAYLFSHFGPDNDAFRPLDVQPLVAARPSSMPRRDEPAPPHP